MAEFLTTKGISYNLEKIIIEAKQDLLLVSPYLRISPIFFDRLKDASNRNVAIRIIYGKKELQSEEFKKLTELKNLKLFYLENLHAKCYSNETQMIITSMNMHEFSEVNNREMGILIDRNNDKDIFDKAKEEVRSIIDAAEQEDLKFSNKEKTTQRTLSKKFNEDTRGFCIRCGTRIPFNPNRPYCGKCFSVWVQYEDELYEEKYCHSCGAKDYDICMISPFCGDCDDDY
ncbi:MAG: phospholipase D family protein [Lentimicrobiaceae bacterium]|jgi:phosphatidylserine/phosphatidylglycerophosphate/cardiolipin synthase-like enzyme|nr:phospholipase D family protein [Lentimicrobiaceae bacterium]